VPQRADTSGENERASLAWWSVLALIAAAGAWLRLWGVGRKWLWWDELLSANFARGELYSVVAEALRFDPHPPGYYLQLHVWMSLFGTSDLALMLNPVAWSVAGIVSVAWLARRLFGDQAGWLAAALYAAMAAPVFLAVQVRMYAMIPTIAVWGFWFHHLASRGRGGRRVQAAALAAEAAIATSHGSGILMLGGLYAYGLWESWRRGNRRLWLLWRIPSALLVSACCVFALVKWASFGHPTRPGPGEIVRGLQWLILNPNAAMSSPELGAAWSVAAWAAWLAWGWLAFRNTTSRAVALLCVLSPIALQIAISHAVRPIWLPRNLAVVTPFFCLAAAGGAYAARGLALRCLGWLLVALFALSGVLQQSRATKGDDFKPAAELTRAWTEPGDLVVFYGIAFDWFCFSWYHRGPDWGDPLADHSVGDGGPRLRRWLSQTGTDRLLFHAEVREWRSGAARVATEYTAPRDWSGAGRVIRVISAPRWSMFRDRKLTQVDGRVLVESKTLPRGQITVQIWR